MKKAKRNHDMDAIVDSIDVIPASLCSLDGASGKPMKKEKVKIFNDLVHTHIKVEGLCLEIVNTPQVASSSIMHAFIHSPIPPLINLHQQYQRMHGLKQLGVCDWVFRGATHTRFEHSLGVAHLAEKVLRGIQDKQPALGITETDVICVKVAALCHDLGHGPFSHVYDG